MYHYIQNEQELGFDAFIAPDDFNPKDATQYGGDHPVDIYEVFKREYALNSHARYIYYYSPGNYPLTLTPTASEYYLVGSSSVATGEPNANILVNVADFPSGYTAFGEITTNKRWVVVCGPSTAKFSLTLAVARAGWLYCGDKINEVKGGIAGMQLKYIHFANLNSITGNFNLAFYTHVAPLTGTIHMPETVTSIASWAFSDQSLITKVYLPNTKNVYIQHDNTWYTFHRESKVLFSFGASTSLPGFNSTEQNAYTNLAVLSVSPQNTAYASFDYCDIIYTKALTAIVWVAPKTVRGLYIPDELPQAQIGVDSTTGIGTKLSTNIMQGYQLYIGTQITDLTNLYLNNKSFTTVEVGAGNAAFTIENNILFNTSKTTLVKAGSASTGSVVMPTLLTSVSPNAFLRYSHTGSIPLIFSGAGKFNLSNYSDFTFATFTGQSLSDIITNNRLVPGAVGSPKYFYINQSSLDALNAYNSNAVSIAATQQYINISTFPQGAVLHLDASNVVSYPGSGTTWYDLSGNGNNGTLVNGVAYSNGVMSFDGVNDYVNLGKGATLKCTTNRFTIAAWIRITALPNEGNGAGIISFGKTEDNNGHEIIIVVTGGVVKTLLRGKGIADRLWSNSALNLNQWYHIAGTWDGSKLSTYVNGILDSEVNTTGTVATDNNANLMGTRTILIPTAASYFTGSGNDYMKFNEKLTSSEVGVVFNSQKSKYGL